MAVASSIAASVRSTIQSALQIHSPSRVMMSLGRYTGEGLALGIDTMKKAVTSSALGLAEGITAPIQYTAEKTPVEEMRTMLSDAPAVSGSTPISATGKERTESLRKEIKLVIEKIILNDTGEKDKKQLIRELLQELIEQLQGADEIFNDSDLGVLL